MVKRAGCASTECNCHVHAGKYGIDVEGVGTDENPYVITALEGSTAMRAVSTPSVSLSLTGTGKENDPYTLSGTLAVTPAYPAARVQRFTSSGTWTKPPGTTTVQVTVVGAGGGGGAGAGQSGSEYLGRGPGMGGGGGGWTRRTFQATQVPDSVQVTVGTGGGGATGVVNSASSPSGASGGASLFGNLLSAGGGPGGVLEQTSSETYPPNNLPVVQYAFRGGSTEGWSYNQGPIAVGTGGVSGDGLDGGRLVAAHPGAGALGYFYSSPVTVVPGSKIYVYAYAAGASALASTTARPLVWWWNTGSGWFEFGAYKTISNAYWTLLDLSTTVPSGVTSMVIGVEIPGIDAGVTPGTPYISRYNAWPNPSFETYLDWTRPAPTGGPNNVSRVNISGSPGAWAMRLTGLGNGYDHMYAYSSMLDVSPNVGYVMSAHFQRNASAQWTESRVRFVVDFYNGGSWTGQSHTGAWQYVTTSPSWFRYHSGYWVTPANCNRIQVTIETFQGPGGTAGTGVYMNVDGILLEAGNGVGTYFDGSYGGAYSWVGAAHASPSKETTTPASTVNPQPYAQISWVGASMQGQVKVPIRAQGTESGGASPLKATYVTPNTYWAPGGGGSGGVATTNSTPSASLGKHGGHPQGSPVMPVGALPALGAAGSTGGIAPDGSNSGGGGGTGGNGSYSDGSVAYSPTNGGPGGFPGGGGGGGGQATGGSVPGNGGRGADGYVEVVSW